MPGFNSAKISFLRPHRKIYKYCARTEIMAYTEVKEKNGKKYYYRVRTLRDGKKFKKERIYLGKNLLKIDLSLKESEADQKFNLPNRDKQGKIIEKIKPKIIAVLKKSKIKKAGIFGSYIRGGHKKNSDIDIVIQPVKNMSLLDISGLKIELEKVLGKKVDLVSYKYIHPYLKNRILKSEIRII